MLPENHTPVLYAGVDPNANQPTEETTPDGFWYSPVGNVTFVIIFLFVVGLICLPWSE